MSLCPYHEEERRNGICQAQIPYPDDKCPDCNPGSVHPDSKRSDARSAKRPKLMSSSPPGYVFTSNGSQEEARQDAFYKLEKLYQKLEDLQRTHQQQPPWFEDAFRSHLREYQRTLFQKKESMKRDLSIDANYIEAIIADYENGI